MPFWFCCFLDLVLCNMILHDCVWLCMITWLGFYILCHFDHRSQPAGATSWKTCLACPKGTYQPIEAATRTASLEGCCLLFVLVSILNETWIWAKIALRVLHKKSKLRLQKRRYAFLVRWATTATKLDRRHVTFARKAGIARIVWVGAFGFQRVPWWSIDTHDLMDVIQYVDGQRMQTNTMTQATMAMPLAWQHVRHAQRAPPPNRMVPFAQVCAMRV